MGSTPTVRTKNCYECLTSVRSIIIGCLDANLEVRLAVDVNIRESTINFKDDPMEKSIVGARIVMQTIKRWQENPKRKKVIKGFKS